MEKLPKKEQSFRMIMDMFTSAGRAKVLSAAMKLNIFSVLSEPAPAEAIARALGTHPGNTGLFLDALASIDLVEKRDGLYKNTPIAEAFLVEKSPTFLGPVVEYHLLSNDAFTAAELVDLVTGGPSLPEKDHTASDEMTIDEVSIYISFQRAGKAQALAEMAAALPEFPLFRKMLDLGCGPGVNCISIVSAHPTMRGVCFDRPTTVAVAQQSIEKHGMSERMGVMAGDYTKDPIGKGYDLILATDTLYYTEEEIAPILSKIYSALNPGGVFMSLQHSLTCDRTKPEELVVGMLYSGLQGQDMGLVDDGFIAEAMYRAGFKSVQSSRLHPDWGEVDLDIGRK